MACPICQKEHPYSTSEALTLLDSTARRLERLTAAMSPKRAAARPAPEKWSAKEIVCHLADCELTYAFRYRKIISEPDPVLVPFDQDAWAKGLRYQAQPLKQALALFSQLRNANVGLLKTTPEENWEKVGQHPQYGALTLRQIVHHLVQHDRNHLAQVEALCPLPAKAARTPRPARKTSKKPVPARKARGKSR
jgi:uncharacterized damage-inducible protein DinB